MQPQPARLLPSLLARWAALSPPVQIRYIRIILVAAFCLIGPVWYALSRPSPPVVVPPYVPPPKLPPFPGELTFDRVYYINLQHRTDRLVQIQNELGSVGWEDRSELVVAIPTPHRGILGCTRTHLRALRRFLADPTLRHALFVEDDMRFVTDPRVNVTRFLSDHGHDGWDVLMLASNTLKEEPYVEYATHVLDAQTTSAYAVTRAFAAKLVDAFELGESVLAVRFEPERYAVDMVWKPLQPVSRWYCLKPKAGMQRVGFSDIEKRTLDYKA